MWVITVLFSLIILLCNTTANVSHVYYKNCLPCREQTCGCQGGGGEWTESLGLADANYYI